MAAGFPQLARRTSSSLPADHGDAFGRLPLIAARLPWASKAEVEESLSTNLGQKRCPPIRHLPSFLSGFFSCGYQLAFITAPFSPPSDRSLRSDPCRWDCCINIGSRPTSALARLRFRDWSGPTSAGTLLAGCGRLRRYSKKYLWRRFNTGVPGRALFIYAADQRRYPGQF